MVFRPSNVFSKGCFSREFKGTSTIDEEADLDMNSSIVRRSANQIGCDMGEEVVILDLKSGTYYGLDDLGARIWNLIEQPASLVTIREAIMSEYEVDAETCDRDILAFLNRMQVAGLVEVGDASPL
jgi:hypothetical protein